MMMIVACVHVMIEKKGLAGGPQGPPLTTQKVPMQLPLMSSLAVMSRQFQFRKPVTHVS